MSVTQSDPDLCQLGLEPGLGPSMRAPAGLSFEPDNPFMEDMMLVAQMCRDVKLIHVD